MKPRGKSLMQSIIEALENCKNDKWELDYLDLNTRSSVWKRYIDVYNNQIKFKTFVNYENTININLN